MQPGAPGGELVGADSFEGGRVKKARIAAGSVVSGGLIGAGIVLCAQHLPADARQYVTTAAPALASLITLGIQALARRLAARRVLKDWARSRHQEMKDCDDQIKEIDDWLTADPSADEQARKSALEGKALLQRRRVAAMISRFPDRLWALTTDLHVESTEIVAPPPNPPKVPKGKHRHR
jgi:hypothetical protein